MKVELMSGDIERLMRWEKILKTYDPQAVEAIEGNDEPSIVVADFDTHKREVLRFLKRTAGQGPISLVVLEGHPTVEHARALLAAGVRAYGNAYMQPVHLLSCVQSVMEGQIWIAPEIVSSLLALSEESGASEELPENFTPRERELTRLLLQGASNREIAQKLGISERTVKAHLSHIYAKMGVSNRLELAVRLRQSRTSTSVQ